MENDISKLILGDATYNIKDKELTLRVEELLALVNKVKETAVPIGTVISYMGNTAPEGYLSCDGSIYNIEEYSVFAEYIEEQFGSVNYFGGDGETTFAVPDLRGEFLRGTGTNSHANNGNGADIGVHQDATQHLTIFANPSEKSFGLLNSPNDIKRQIYPDSLIRIAGSTTTSMRSPNGVNWNSGAENPNLFTSRPTNTSVLYCIKYI